MSQKSVALLVLGLFSYLSINPTRGNAIPQGFNVQGRLTDAQGVNRDGIFSIRFTIFDKATGGTELWKKDLPTVAVRNGNFQVILQDPDDLDRTLVTATTTPTPFLEIQVLGGPGITAAEVPLVPRQLLVSVPFALRATVADTVTFSPVPVGAIFIFLSTQCPVGFEQVPELTNRFPIGVDSASLNPAIPDQPNQFGGAETHTHTLSAHFHSGTTGNTNSIATSHEHHSHHLGVEHHTHNFTTGAPQPDISGSTTQYPPFLTVLFCRKL